MLTAWEGLDGAQAAVVLGCTPRAFRRAYRAGTLRDLGSGRYEVPFRHIQAAASSMTSIPGPGARCG
jgi:hypothetical protein